MSIDPYAHITRRYAAFVAVSTAASVCGVSKNTVFGWKRRKRIRFIKLSKEVRVRLSDALFMKDAREKNMPVGSTTKDYYTVKEIAARLSVSRNTIYVALANKMIPYVEFGAKVYRIPAAKFDKMLDRMEREGLSLQEYNAKYGG